MPTRPLGGSERPFIAKAVPKSRIDECRSSAISVPFRSTTRVIHTLGQTAALELTKATVELIEFLL
jgi:hypothetical protein